MIRLIICALLCTSFGFAEIVDVRFDSANVYQGPLGGYSLVGVGPHNLNINHAASDIQAICYDAYDEVYSGETWQAEVFTTGDLSQAYFHNQAGYETKYREVIYLASLFSHTEQSQWGDLHMALWNIFDPDFTSDGHGHLTPLAQQFQQLAIANGPNTYTGGWTIIDDIHGHAQGFLVPNPEPATFGFLGVGLVAMGLFKKKKRA